MTEREKQQSAIFHQILAGQTEAPKSADSSAFGRYKTAREKGQQAALNSALQRQGEGPHDV